MTGRDGVRRWWSIAVGAVLLAAAFWGARMYVRSVGSTLPYRDAFAQGKADEWKAFGGTWELADGSMRNDSDERGAKLLTGSPRWQNYSIEADVMLLGLGGDAGLVLRSSDEEPGVDAYTGYYAGLRTVDQSLVIGRAGHEWAEIVQKLTVDPPGVHASRWYHLKLLAYGCQVAVRATLLPDQRNGTTIGITDRECIHAGRAGLRSYASGGVWRNVTVRSASQADLAEMLTTAWHAPADASHRLAAEQSAWDLYTTAASPSLPSNSPAQLISSLRLLALAQPVRATIHGTVVLASPAVYVQDATGGVAVQQLRPMALKVGDEVEVTGTARASAFSSVLEQASVRVLWENTPMPPVSVIASQAATGAFDSTFIEVEGRLSGKERGPGDRLTFTFEAGPQSFRAVMNRGRGDTLYSTLKPGSMLRLRGVAVSDPNYTQDMVPFSLLLRSSDDAVLLAGPPWWNARHALLVVVGVLLLGMSAHFFYHRVENWRLRAVLEERERMAYEMHDTLSQSFAGIGFQLKAIREGMPTGLPRLQQQLDLASELVRHSHEETRRSIAVLGPVQPGSEGLVEALRECATRLVEGGSVNVLASCSGDVARTPLRVADTLYHVGQEALANAVRHGQPATLEIRLSYEKSFVHLQIEDDGSGFVASEEMAGFGLRSMRKRAAAIGATLEICSSPGAGTRVSIRCGLKSRRPAAGRPPLAAEELWRQIRHVASTGRFDTSPHRG